MTETQPTQNRLEAVARALRDTELWRDQDGVATLQLYDISDSDITKLARAALAADATATGDVVAGLVEALEEAKRQLTYIDERSPSGTTPAVIAQIDHRLTAYHTTMKGEAA